MSSAARGSEKVGPSEDYRALLRGEITPEEYVERLKARVDERFAQEAAHRKSPRSALRRTAEKARQMHRLYPFTKTRSRHAR